VNAGTDKAKKKTEKDTGIKSTKKDGLDSSKTPKEDAVGQREGRDEELKPAAADSIHEIFHFRAKDDGKKSKKSQHGADMKPQIPVRKYRRFKPTTSKNVTIPHLTTSAHSDAQKSDARKTDAIVMKKKAQKIRKTPKTLLLRGLPINMQNHVRNRTGKTVTQHMPIVGKVASNAERKLLKRKEHFDDEEMKGGEVGSAERDEKRIKRIKLPSKEEVQKDKEFQEITKLEG
jgi:hypothetical protein